MPTILIVEDTVKLAQNIAAYLEAEQYTVTLAHDGDSGLALAKRGGIDLLILDLNLPGRDGLEICQLLRASGSSVPILMLTARTGTEHTVAGLNTGADDYLGKPFDLTELLARVRALLRREAASKDIVFTVGDVTLDTNTHLVTKGGSPVSLAPKEYALLEYLLRFRGLAQDRTTLIEEVWGEDSELLFSQTVDVHVAYLRRKLGKDLIQTVPGTGYVIL